MFDVDIRFIGVVISIAIFFLALGYILHIRSKRQ